MVGLAREHVERTDIPVNAFKCTPKSLTNKTPCERLNEVAKRAEHLQFSLFAISGKYRETCAVFGSVTLETHNKPT